MNKSEFLKELEKEIQFLNQEEIKKVIASYEKMEEEAIASLELEQVIKDICKQYGMNYDIVVSKHFSKFFREFYNDLLSLGTMLRNSDRQKRIKIIIDLVLLLVVTCVLKIPFIFVRDLGDNLITSFFNSNLTALAIWGLIMEIIYVVVALSFFIKTFQKWFKNME